MNIRLRFDRNEISGAFGDIGTDFPLIVSLILICRLDAASVLSMFGFMLVLSGLIYRMPMPVQPLKAMALIAITQKLSANVLYGGGLAIGLAMLILTVTGALGWCARIVPKSVVRGIQFGLGLSLCSLAFRDYIPSDGMAGYVLAAIAFIITIFLLGNRKVPPSLIVITLGFIYAVTIKVVPSGITRGMGLALPTFHVVSLSDLWSGLILLALPQLPLSLGNSILATRQIADDYFPGRAPSIPRIGFTYSIMNLLNPFFGGIPTCHGSGGMAGHYAFGGRTGGSVIIYGAFYLILGLLFSRVFEHVAVLFPLPVLGVILVFEGLALMLLARDMANSTTQFTVVVLVGLIAFGLPNGYIIGLLVGTFLVYLMSRRVTGLTNGD